ncbi:retrovirus-related pol polyprotein from transposon TNT 1-94 [Tanacetum coccineum]
MNLQEADLEENMSHWVRKEFKNFNEDARLSIQHWKYSWHKRVYKQNQRRVRNNLEDYFSNLRIIEVVIITTDQPHGLDFMEQIIVMRENDKPDSFSEADFKYLNKDGIEDLYYLCRNKKVNYRETKLMNSLITFIRSRVIWERFHDFQLGIESYQVKVNLTAPTLTFPGIETYEPYSIVDKPNTGLIYLNNKDEKRVMYLVEIVKFYDATLEKVLKEVKLKIFQSEPWKKPPLLGELHRDIMRAFEREITKRLSHREQIIASLHQEFFMTDLDSLNYFMGISATRDSSKMFLSQRKYATEILEWAHMVNCNPSRTPANTESKLADDDEPISDSTLYRSLAETCWLRNLLRELHTPLSSAMLVYCDNVDAGEVRVLHVLSRYQYADIFTKGFPSNLFEELMRYFAFGRHLEEIHVTWAHLEKKRTILRTYINIAQEFLYSGWRRHHQYNVTPSQRRPRRRHWIS